MAAPRPNFIDLRTDSTTSIPYSMKSPRLHIAGQHPPELSPLDAFALQSRLLAQQLEESARSGNRLSRLPPLTIESPLIVQGRSDYFRSLSYNSPVESNASPQLLSAGSGGLRPDVAEWAERPVSMHPRMSRMPPMADNATTPGSIDYTTSRQLGNIDEEDSSYGARRVESPGSIHSTRSSIVRRPKDITITPHVNTTPKPPPSPAHSSARSTNYPLERSSFESLAPPPPMFPKRTSSIMSSPGEGFGQDLMLHSPNQPIYRKLSGSSGIFSPPTYQRSPSMCSDASSLPRPSFNFSRPLSRVGTPEQRPLSRIETPSRQASADMQESMILADATAHSPVSVHSEAFLDAMKYEDSAAQSYIYSKFALPRGKLLQRSNSDDIEPQSPTSRLEPPSTTLGNIKILPFGGQAPPSPDSRPSSSSAIRSDLEQRNPTNDFLHPGGEVSAPASRMPSRHEGRFSEDTSRARVSTSPMQAILQQRPSTAAGTSDSNSTIRASPSSHQPVTKMADISAEEHVDKGIALHQAGKLNESSYHLRFAAKQNHPTGMLLYALACRHGWGRRIDLREGVYWLRKATECANSEIADDEDNAKDGKHVDALQRKTRKAQLALSIYELGVSHMNGWGIEQDKALALRCFEIAGEWGDVDALAEAGFCYAKGVGCKKNLKKSAGLYRQAEAKGMSMIGNSWIHKSKYNEDNESPKAKRKTRSKSMSRSIFGLKKSNTSASATSA